MRGASARSQKIVLRGAREHNLQNIDLEIPRNRLVVLTGLSGSGKSSLAFDTLYAEAQRRYFEAQAKGARPLLAQLPKPQLDSAEGLTPPLALQQRAGRRNPRSTVGTVTEVNDSLRLLYARVGSAQCVRCARACAPGACAHCGERFPALTPELFSFNRREGACPACSGLGVREEFDPQKMAPDPALSLTEGALAAWGGRRMSRYHRRVLEGLACALGFSLDAPFGALSKNVRHTILYGAGAREFRFRLPRRYGGVVRKRFDGVAGELARRGSAPGASAESASKFSRAVVCPACAGARLGPHARNVRVAGRALHEIAALPLTRAREVLAAPKLKPRARAIALRALGEVRERLDFLCGLGLGYLSLARATDSLSGGEAQRIRLGAQLGARLFGVLYVLDEPSIGLHPRDNERLLESLLRLRDAGNSVLVVEHDEATIRRADHVIDLGPGAGAAGGRVVAAGTPRAIIKNRASLTGAYLAGRKPRAQSAARPLEGARRLEMRGCHAHNLKHIHVAFPLERLCVVTGVSGSGKSTLVTQTLRPALAQHLQNARARGARNNSAPQNANAAPQQCAYEQLLGAEHVQRVAVVDQSPLGRTPRSNPLTYTGAFDALRRLFAGVPEARMRGYGAGRFSFNVRGGRCEVCSGDGGVKVEMKFLPDLFVRCERCAGRRYNRETLEVRYRGLHMAEVLELSVTQGLALFENASAVARPLAALESVGLGYLKLGQPATTLSGGEAQRIRLARELAAREAGGVLYLLDEPTTGLHFADIERLLGVLQQLVERGNTVLIVEHQLDVIRSADFVLDLGPEGGEAGGRVVASGTPAQVARVRASHTGQALARGARSL